MPARKPRSGLRLSESALQRASGFTLIELLVVLVIVGVLVSLSVLAIGDNRGQELEREARRLHAVVQLASEEAILRSRIIGIRFEPDGYYFVYQQGEAWERIEGDRFLRPHTLPEPLRVDLVVDGLDGGIDTGGEAQRNQPQVVLLTSGELIPFEATLSHPDLTRIYLIEGHLDGRLDFHSDD